MRWKRLAAALSVATWACSPPGGDGDADADTDADTDTDTDGDADEDTPFACHPGEHGCYQGVHYLCGDDGRTRLEETPCPQACDPALGCVMCVPGSRRCEEQVSMVCSARGDAWFTGRDCGEWGSTCVSGTGYCNDLCAEAESGDSYVGCEYWPTPLANTSELDYSIFDYRVVVANPSSEAASVRVTRAGAEAFSGTVPVGGLIEIPLPWVDGQSFGIPGEDWQSIVVADAAYRLTSSVPVTVSQFNPFEYNVGEVYSYTNDATLLLPTHVLTGDYVGVTYVPFSRAVGTRGMPFPTPPDYAKYPDYIAVVGIAPEGTDVQVRVAGHAVGASGLFGDTALGGTLSFTLRRGEVAHVASAVHPNCQDSRPGYNRAEECTFGICDYMDTCREAEYDLTGSRVTANRPVEVFGGHVCAYVPYTSEACDHLEVQLPPIQTWGREYISAPMGDSGTSPQNLVRVVAAFDGTSVSVDPPQGGVGEATLGAGQWVEFFGSGPFHVTATSAVMVGQFILGQFYPEPDAARGDPAMTVLVPGEQYRSDYTFITPTSYRAETNGQSYVLIVRPIGLELTLDGTAVSTAWQTIAGREVGTVAVAGGTHTIAGSAEFGLIAFGLGSFTSYAYPAGLNLEQITPIY